MPENFRLSGRRDLADTWRARAAANIDAIALSTQIEAEGRPATPDEQIVLSRFVGFGAADLANSVFRDLRTGGFRDTWAGVGAELEDVVPPGEIDALARSVQYAHFTPEVIVEAMWAGALRLGFDGGRALDAGMGIGIFPAMVPYVVAPRTRFCGVEADPVTARIARLLQPDADVLACRYEDVDLDPDFTLAIGNPPFANIVVKADPGYAEGFQLHDYFIVKSLDLLRPGGVGAFVTSRGTMDKTSARARERMAEACDLVGAVRLPDGVFKADAGTDVGVDVLFFVRRAPGAPAGDTRWIHSDERSIRDVAFRSHLLPVNQYFVDHPEMVLGEMRAETGPHGMRLAVTYPSSVPLAVQLDASIRTMRRHAVSAPVRPEDLEPVNFRTRVGKTGAPAPSREGSFLVGLGGLMQITNGRETAVPVRAKGVQGMAAAHVALVRALVEIRDHVREVLRLQQADEDSTPAQTALGRAYEAFVAARGPINRTLVTVSPTADGGERRSYRYPNLSPFRDDPDCWLVASIERYDPETDTAEKTAIFTGIVVRPPVAVEIRSPSDALAVSLARFGGVKASFLGEALGLEPEDAVAALGNAVFTDPTSGLLLTADDYLSGPVRMKLDAARDLARRDPAFERNVAALEAVQPMDIPPSDITAQLGAPWVPVDVIEAFAREVMGVKRPMVKHEASVGMWVAKSHSWDAAADARFGIPLRGAILLLSDTLNNVATTIHENVIEDGQPKRVIDPIATEAARTKVREMRQAFSEWVWTDGARTDTLARLYNDLYNDIVPRAFDGRHMTLDGASPAFKFYDHQKRAIWRIVAAGSTYIAHAVGAGKTGSIAAAVMEQRRLGFVTKALLAVPGHCLAQCAGEFLSIYPTARIIVADEMNFARENRRRFLARTATGEWDCIIITHSALRFIPLPVDFERAFVAEQVATFAAAQDTIGKEDRATFRKLQAARERIERRLESLDSDKDDFLTLDDLGVDQIIVDECFPYDTLIQTEAGWMKIGDFVKSKSHLNVASYNHETDSVEWKPVKRWLRRSRATQLVRVVHERGAFVCTPNHPIATKSGQYIEAGALITGERLLAMRDCISPGFASQHVLLGRVQDPVRDPEQAATPVCGVRCGRRTATRQPYTSVLFSAMRQCLAIQGSSAARSLSSTNCPQLGLLEGQTKSGDQRTDAREQPDGERGDAPEAVYADERSHISGPRWKRRNHRAAGNAGRSAWLTDGICDQYGASVRSLSKPSALLQGRLSRSCSSTRNRDRWKFASHAEMEIPGQTQDGGLSSSRVVCVEVLQQGGAHWPNSLRGESDELFDLEVVDNHNFIAEGVLVHNCHEFRKLSFATGNTTLKGVDPDGSMMAWDLYAKIQFVRRMRERRHAVSERYIDRAVVLSSGTPLTNTMGEMFTVQRYMDPDALEHRSIQSFDAWAACFGDSRASLELQPSGRYKPVTRFCEFINIPELFSLFRSFADVVLPADLRSYVRVPELDGGERKIVTAPRSAAFKAFQRSLDLRIQEIERRTGRPKPGDDILLSVINDGRLGAIDLRMVDPGALDDPTSKLNLMIAQIHDIYIATSEWSYTDAKGARSPRRGAAQMVFSDLGTPAALERRGFSAYLEVRDKLVARGVPRSEIAFIQDCADARAKARLFAAVRAGEVRIILGSSQKMGTGANVQKRLAALHHLDVPWLPSQIEQREGRIRRQGNENDMVSIFAYATLGSMDATMWQANERKARFINAVLAGDKSVRRLEDIGEGDADQFAMAKAISSGDPRLMQKAGLESEVARLDRLRLAHFDSQASIRSRIRSAEKDEAWLQGEIAATAKDLARRTATPGFVVDGVEMLEHDEAGKAMMRLFREHNHDSDEPLSVVQHRGFKLRFSPQTKWTMHRLHVLLTEGRTLAVHCALNASGVDFAREIAEAIGGLDRRAETYEARLASAARERASLTPLVGQTFRYAEELDLKRAELAGLDRSLALTGSEPVAEEVTPEKCDADLFG